MCLIGENDTPSKIKLGVSNFKSHDFQTFLKEHNISAELIDTVAYQDYMFYGTHDNLLRMVREFFDEDWFDELVEEDND